MYISLSLIERKGELMRLIKTLRFFAVSLLLLILAACAISSNRTHHSFQLDPSRESVGIDLLFYRYGSANEFGLRTSKADAEQGVISPGIGMSGVLPVGDDLYVKWRDKKTGQIYEDTVDLKSRLPSSMYKQELHPIIEGSQLYVYLISYEPVRDVMSMEDVERIRRTHKTLREKAFSFRLRNRVIQIYPEKIIDPHLPLDFKK
jgi:hypothetical protein